jgi:hypothetical protein
VRALIAALLLAALPAQAQIYKCVDARGTTHYSDKPLPDCKGVAVDIRGQEPISGQLQNAGDLGAAERDFQQRRIERERAEEAQARAAADRQRRCAQLRTELQRLQYIRRPSDATDLERRLAETGAQIARECPS